MHHTTVPQAMVPSTLGTRQRSPTLSHTLILMFISSGVFSMCVQSVHPWCYIRSLNQSSYCLNVTFLCPVRIKIASPKYKQHSCLVTS